MGGYGGAVLQGRKFQRASARLELPGTGYLLRSRASPLSLDRYEGRIRYRPVSRRVAPRTHEGTGRFLERLVASMAPMTEREGKSRDHAPETGVLFDYITSRFRPRQANALFYSVTS